MRRQGAIRLAAALAILGGLLPLSRAGAEQESGTATQRVVRISVLSLFKPSELRLSAAKGAPLQITVRGRSCILPHEADEVTLRAVNSEIQTQCSLKKLRGSSLCAQSQLATGKATQFWLEVPGKLRRAYLGTLEVRAHGRTLEAVVTMSLETAVASIVQAESPPGAGMEALKAQAVAARSFLVARQTAHTGFDFCDTTHCQFLRSPPAQDGQAAQAARSTKGLVLTFRDDANAQDATLAAMYARSCGGRTRTLREIGVQDVSGYPYYAVPCAYCRRHPEAWQREARGAQTPRSEKDRLAWNRIHGWGAIPSLSTQSSAASDSGIGVTMGRGTGHGLGLCQLGAADMARHGARFTAILAHYYPNTHITTLARP